MPRLNKKRIKNVTFFPEFYNLKEHLIIIFQLRRHDQIDFCTQLLDLSGSIILYVFLLEKLI